MEKENLVVMSTESLAPPPPLLCPLLTRTELVRANNKLAIPGQAEFSVMLVPQPCLHDKCMLWKAEIHDPMFKEGYCKLGRPE